MLKYIPVTLFFEGKDYFAGQITEVPKELAKLIDEYVEKNNPEIQKLAEVNAIAIETEQAKAKEMQEMAAEIDNAEPISPKPVSAGRRKVQPEPVPAEAPAE